MAVDEALAALAAQVGSFHITDRAMVRAQRDIEAALQSGNVDHRRSADYMQAVRRYFGGFNREAKDRLREVDRRLVAADQVHFNLAAERGVAVKRIEATQAILEAIEAFEKRAPS